MDVRGLILAAEQEIDVEKHETEEQRQQQDAKLMTLKEAGMTFAQAGKAMGVSKQAAWKRYQRILAEIRDQGTLSRELHRIAVNGRYETMISRLWRLAVPNPVTRKNPDTGVQETIIPTPDYNAVRELHAILRSITSLNGLEKPVINPAIEQSADAGLKVGMLLIEFIPEERRAEALHKLQAILNLPDNASDDEISRLSDGDTRAKTSDRDTVV